MIRVINDRVAVAPQVRPEDVAVLAAQGYRTLVNNRPDGEEPGQPEGEAVRAAAEAAGMRYVAVPVGHSGIGHAQLSAMGQALAAGDGLVLAFCRSGTRSCNLWALSAARDGAEPAELVAQAAAAGYDLSGIRPTLDALAAGR